MEREISRLGPDARLLQSGRWLVALAEAQQIPALLHEIGRLRECAFRAVGEGTGGELDLDRFDPHYRHLIVWDLRERRLAGAYRLADTESLRADSLPQALYTHSLFAYEREFLARLGPALELGRAFVRPEYQRCSRALALLWAGIVSLLARLERPRLLFGAVSVSALYTPPSRALIAAALLAHHRHAPTLGLVRAREPFELDPPPRIDLAALADVRALDAAVAALEPDGKRLPVLLRRYLQLGGKFAAFHVDSDFGSTLDGLMLLDPARADADLLSRVGVPRREIAA